MAGHTGNDGVEEVGVGEVGVVEGHAVHHSVPAQGVFETEP